MYPISVKRRNTLYSGTTKKEEKQKVWDRTLALKWPFQKYSVVTGVLLRINYCKNQFLITEKQILLYFLYHRAATALHCVSLQAAVSATQQVKLCWHPYETIQFLISIYKLWSSCVQTLLDQTDRRWDAIDFRTGEQGAPGADIGLEIWEKWQESQRLTQRGE